MFCFGLSRPWIIEETETLRLSRELLQAHFAYFQTCLICKSWNCCRWITTPQPIGTRPYNWQSSVYATQCARIKSFIKQPTRKQTCFSSISVSLPSVHPQFYWFHVFHAVNLLAFWCTRTKAITTESSNRDIIYTFKPSPMNKLLRFYN
jgi:hypothetical protein